MINLQKPFSHYYGDAVRVIFVVAGVIMLLGLPVMREAFDLPVGILIVAVVVLGLAGGLSNPVQKRSLIINVVVSVIGLICFAYFTWLSYENSVGGSVLFVSQILSIMFLISSYLSMKSLRGTMVS